MEPVHLNFLEGDVIKWKIFYKHYTANYGASGF